MIIFDLDGTLADCEHRRHFVDKSYITCGINCNKNHRCLYCLRKLEKDQPNWQAFYEACDQDKPIYPTIDIFHSIIGNDRCYVNNKLMGFQKLEIWSGRCESVRQKTEKWLQENIYYNFCDFDFHFNLKMRPIGDYTPDDVLKERWLDEAIAQGKKVEYVFDDRPKVVRMYRRRGIFVFDCNQSGEEF